MLLLPHVHLLDLAGPVQAFYEAGHCGASYALHFIAPHQQVRTAQGLTLAQLAPLAELGPHDTLLVPGTASTSLDRMAEYVPTAWLRENGARVGRLASVCSGAFMLAHAGLLTGRACTTHWKVMDRLAAYPGVRILANRLFVRDGHVITSAGESSGIDMAMSLIEEDYGPSVTGRVAREMVVYLRREGRDPQVSIYLAYRNHLHPGIHKVQDWVVGHPDRNANIDELADLAAMSSRNLTRVFRQVTGITLKTFVNRLKLEVAANLIHNPELTFDCIARECGFQHPRQLRRLWKETHGVSPSTYRARLARVQDKGEIVNGLAC